MGIKVYKQDALSMLHHSYGSVESLRELIYEDTVFFEERFGGLTKGVMDYEALLFKEVIGLIEEEYGTAWLRLSELEKGISHFLDNYKGGCNHSNRADVLTAKLNVRDTVLNMLKKLALGGI